MYYRVNIEDGYIHGVVKGVSPENSNISEEEYHQIRAIFEDVPTAPDGFYYRLKENLEWELCERPAVEETATEEDYHAALESLGVNFNA
jgi:hypothetical protein